MFARELGPVCTYRYVKDPPEQERTWQAMAVYAPHYIRFEEPVMPKDVLVEVRAVAICGLDVHWYKDGRIGTTVVRTLLVLDYEEELSYGERTTCQ